ncbi:MAG TPA: flagellar biosynthesis regulator FlaF [Thermodesulfovibrionales bacterium]|nr:flagellar biosynthesis regulator FlaF [Thermodesulfovibrionales bacterium]
MYASQLEAYRTVEKTTMSGRELEASVLAKAALMLKECQDNWEGPDHAARLQKALRNNQMVWTIFESELAREDNPLPKQLRLDILRLGGFVDKRIFEVMANPSPEKLTMIININLNLAAGLRGAP